MYNEHTDDELKDLYHTTTLQWNCLTSMQEKDKAGMLSLLHVGFAKGFTKNFVQNLSFVELSFLKAII